MYFIYVKTHNVTGLKYLGFTSRPDPSRYKGSGLYWKLHLEMHGNNVSTEIVRMCDTKEEVKVWGLHFSQLWNVVDSNDWANLKVESGDGGCPKGTNLGRTHSAATRLKISTSKSGVSINRTAAISDETKAKIRKTLTGRKRSEASKAKHNATRKENGPFFHSEETKTKMRKPKSEKAKANMKANHTRPCEGGRWINDGIKSKICHSSTVPDGWFSGRLKKPAAPSQKGKFWVTDGVQNKMVMVVPTGWRKGRTKK